MIFLGTPSGGRVHWRTIESAQRDKDGGVVGEWRIVASPLLHANRNALFQRFLRSGRPYMVQVDDDVAWEAGTLERLVAALSGAHPVAFADMPDRQMETTAYLWREGGDLEPAPYRPEPHEVDAFGTGLFALGREFALTLPPAPFDLRHHNGFQRREDLSFSLLLQARGVRPLCLPRLAVEHHMVRPALPRTR